MRGLAFARPHHLALHESRINLVGSDEIEICAGIGHHLLARRQVAVEHAEHRCLQAAKRFVEHGAVQRFFVLEVVVQQSLVDPGRARDGIGARAGNAVLGKFLRGRLQNGGAALLRLAAGTHAAGQSTPAIEKFCH